MSGLWHRLFGRIRDDVVRREVEKEQMSPAERQYVSQRIEDLDADRVTQGYFGGMDSERVLASSSEPSSQPHDHQVEALRQRLIEDG